MILAELQEAEGTDHAGAEHLYRPALGIVRFLAFPGGTLPYEQPRQSWAVAA